MDGATWRAKDEALEAYRAALGFEVLSVTTSLDAADYDDALFAYAWTSAALDGHAATGWGEPLYSAGDALAPWRSRPGGTSARRWRAR